VIEWEKTDEPDARGILICMMMVSNWNKVDSGGS
jgi:hypothetical protein